MRLLALSLFAFVLSIAGTASAQSPGSYAQRASPYGGAVTLRAYYYASDTCQAALSGKRGAPAGQAVPKNYIPVTIVIGPNPKGCGDSRLVTRLMTVSGPSIVSTIRIFFVNTSGRILKIENVSMPFT